MSVKTRIARAYCVQLKKVVSIAEARREFFLRPEPRHRFDFLCSTESCRELDEEARITAVNYSKQPTDTYKTAHFRANPNTQHSSDCDWIIDDELEGPDGRLQGESEEEAKHRRAKRKLHDYVDVFQLKREQPDGAGYADDADGDECGASRNARSGGVTRATRRASHHRTSSFDRLVECYRHAYAELPTDEFKAMRLRIVGGAEGDRVVRLSRFFEHISYANLGAYDRVIHGGANFEGWYGEGFKLKFMDWIDKKPVFLYVSSEQMRDFHFRRYLEQTLRQEDADYFTVYAMGELKLSPSGKSLDLNVSDLSYLTLIPGMKNQTANTAGSRA